MSKNRQAEPFRLFVRRKGDDFYFCAMGGKPSYLCERGEEWKRLGVATHYYVSNIRQPF